MFDFKPIPLSAEGRDNYDNISWEKDEGEHEDNTPGQEESGDE